MGLNRAKQWLARNAKALQGAAAVCLIIGSVFAAWHWVGRTYGSDLIVRVDWNQSTIPPELAAWTATVSELPPVSDRSATEHCPSSDFFLRKIAQLLDSPTGKLLHDRLGIGSNVGRLEVVIQNNTNDTIPGVRIRVDRFRSFWQVHLKSDMLTEKEVNDFSKQVEPQTDSSAVLLPELPPLPADSLTIISLYGDGEFAEVGLAASGHTIKITKTFKAEDSWLLTIARKPVLYVFPLVSLLIALLPLVWHWASALALNKALPAALYNFACSEAMSGRAPFAIALLEKAFLLGYDDKTHARTDPDLASLRNLPEFKALVGPP